MIQNKEKGIQHVLSLGAAELMDEGSTRIPCRLHNARFTGDIVTAFRAFPDRRERERF